MTGTFFIHLLVAYESTFPDLSPILCVSENVSSKRKPRCVFSDWKDSNWLRQEVNKKNPPTCSSKAPKMSTLGNHCPAEK